MQTTKAQISLRNLISAFVIGCLDSIVIILAKSKISRLYLVYVAEQTGLSQTPKIFAWQGSINAIKQQFHSSYFKLP